MTALTPPELVIEASTTFVISSAIATRDFQDVHHDRDRAVQRGSQDIFVNILTTTGLVQRFVTDWAGPQAIVRNVAIRLGAPCYAGDTLTFTGQAEPAGPAEPSGPPGSAEPSGPAAEPGPGPDGTEYLVRVTGRCSLGDHVTGTVRVLVPGSPA
jgi:MaoC like domain